MIIEAVWAPHYGVLHYSCMIGILNHLFCTLFTYSWIQVAMDGNRAGRQHHIRIHWPSCLSQPHFGKCGSWQWWWGLWFACYSSRSFTDHLPATQPWDDIVSFKWERWQCCLHFMQTRFERITHDGLKAYHSQNHVYLSALTVSNISLTPANTLPNTLSLQHRDFCVWFLTAQANNSDIQQQ